MTRSCIECDYCDPNRKNNFWQVRCNRLHKYVNCYSDCDYFTNPTYDSFMSELLKELENEQK